MRHAHRICDSDNQRTNTKNPWNSARRLYIKLCEIAATVKISNISHILRLRKLRFSMSVNCCNSQSARVTVRITSSSTLWHLVTTLYSLFSNIGFVGKHESNEEAAVNGYCEELDIFLYKDFITKLQYRYKQYMSLSWEIK